MHKISFYLLSFGGLWFFARLFQDNRSSCKILQDDDYLARSCKITLFSKILGRTCKITIRLDWGCHSLTRSSTCSAYTWLDKMKPSGTEKNEITGLPYYSCDPVPNSQPNSVLSQSLIQVTFCTEFV